MLDRTIVGVPPDWDTTHNERVVDTSSVNAILPIEDVDDQKGLVNPVLLLGEAKMVLRLLPTGTPCELTVTSMALIVSMPDADPYCVKAIEDVPEGDQLRLIPYWIEVDPEL